MVYEISGKVKSVGDVQTFASGFTKRTLVIVEGDEKSKYPNVIAFDFKKEKGDLLKRISEGDEVKVKFSISGREWEDTRRGMMRYFTTLEGFQIEVTGGSIRRGAAPSPAIPPADAGMGGDDDMPF